MFANLKLDRPKILNILLVLSVIIAVMSWYFKTPNDALSQEAFLSRVNTSMQQQFCNVIYSRLEQCVTFNKQECKDIVSTIVDSCVNLSKDNIPHFLDPATYKEQFAKIGTCVSTNMHDTIIKSYLIDSETCQTMMQ